MGHEEICDYFLEILPTLTTTENEKVVAELLTSSEHYKKHAHEILVELEWKEKIRSKPGIINEKPMRFYELV